jgi:ribose/xylose/arabinose/galactoside ABC-type transport system permease subunit
MACCSLYAVPQDLGGRGSVLPRALLVQSVQLGLSMIDADPYSYPVVVGTIILLAVLIDRRRQWVAGSV